MKNHEAVVNDDIASKYIRSGIPRGKIDKQECFVVLILNTQYGLIGRPMLIAMGTANNVEIHVRDIFREAIKRNAVGIVVGHNHPTGLLIPSSFDISLTERIEESGKLIGISVLDSIIVSKNKHISKSEGEWESLNVSFYKRPSTNPCCCW